MSNRKKLGVCLLIIGLAALLACFCALRILDRPRTYSSAKQTCTEFLQKRQKEMEIIALDAISLNQDSAGKFLEYSYRCSKESATVTFEMDAQGMLGGQYWQLVYTEDGTFNGQSEDYLHTEVGGNNIVRAEKVALHWWFCWQDYDGTERSYQ